MIALFCKFILKIAGWRITGEYPYEIPKKVLIVAPHTSNWDFLLGILVRQSLRDKIQFVAKKSLFRPPFGWVMKWIGGVAVDRTKTGNFVQAIIDKFNELETFNVVLAPEGTRSRVGKFRTGFYYIAEGAGAPVIPIKFDYEHKLVDFGKPFYPSGSASVDIGKLERYFAEVRGRHPDLGMI